MDYDHVFPDTNILMHHCQELYALHDKIYICGVVLEELDRLKESSDAEKAYLARTAARTIQENESETEFLLCENNFGLECDLDLSRNDNRIINLLHNLQQQDNAICGVSNDLLFRLKCRLLKINCIEFKPQKDILYTGYKIIDLTDEELALWYASEIKTNKWNLKINEYGLLRNNGVIVDKIKRTKSCIETVKFKTIQTAFSNTKIKPRNIQQELAFDMLQDPNTHYKCLIGRWGSGKDFLMINTALQLIEEHKYDKIVWVVQNFGVKDTKDIGALPGGLNEKLMPFTNILSDKLGGQSGLNMFIANRQIEIVPLAYMRGRNFDRSILMLSEAENVTKEHMQLLMSRVGEKSMLMVNGDFKQTDSNIFKANSGLKVFIEKLQGHEEFGYVMFEKTERSKLAEMAGLLD